MDGTRVYQRELYIRVTGSSEFIELHLCLNNVPNRICHNYVRLSAEPLRINRIMKIAESHGCIVCGILRQSVYRTLRMKIKKRKSKHGTNISSAT